jgi:ferredoxin
VSPTRKAPTSASTASPASLARRKFINSVAGAAGGGCLLALGAGLWARQASALAGAGDPAARRAARGRLPRRLRALRPVRARLPLRHLKLADLGDPVATGTPYFVARDIPCEMCEDIPCVKACPTGALDRELTDITQGEDGPGGAGRPGELPELPRPALRRLLPRLPGDRQGDHARTRTTRAPTARAALADGAFRALHRLRQVREILRAARGGDQGLPAQLAQGALPARTTARAGKKSDRMPEGTTLPGHFDPGSSKGLPSSPFGSEGKLPDGAPR